VFRSGKWLRLHDQQFILRLVFALFDAGIQVARATGHAAPSRCVDPRTPAPHKDGDGVGSCQVHPIANGVFDAGIDVEVGVGNLAWPTMN
jgi:hypothetical protein